MNAEQLAYFVLAGSAFFLFCVGIVFEVRAIRRAKNGKRDRYDDGPFVCTVISVALPIVLAFVLLGSYAAFQKGVDYERTCKIARWADHEITWTCVEKR